MPALSHRSPDSRSRCGADAVNLCFVPISDRLLAVDPLWLIRHEPSPRHRLAVLQVLAARWLQDPSPHRHVTVSRAVTLLLEAWSHQVWPEALSAQVHGTVSPVLAVVGPGPGADRYLAWFETRVLGGVAQSGMRTAATRIAARWAGAATLRARLRAVAAGSEGPGARAHALRALLIVGADPAAVELARTLLITDDGWLVRAAAAEVLCARRDPADRALVRGAARNDRNGGARASIVRALAATFAGAADRDLLRASVADDPYLGVQAEALTGLAADVGDPATVDLLRDEAVGNEDHRARSAAVRVLASAARDDPGTVALLCRIGTDDASEFVRNQVVASIGECRLTDPAVMLLLRRAAIEDPRDFVRAHALQVLAELAPDDPATATLVGDRAATDEAGQVRCAAVAAAARVHLPDPVATLVAASEDRAPEVRAAAITAMTTLAAGDPQILAAVHRCAAPSEDRTVQAAAITALAVTSADDPATREVLLAHVTEGSSSLRDALEVLLHIPAHRAAVANLLVAGAGADDWHRRLAAVLTIGAVMPGDPDRLPLLERLIQEPSVVGTVRAAAVSVLGRHWGHDPRTLPLLFRRATDDRYGWVRLAAVDAIVGLDAARPDVLLLLARSALADEDRQLRELAVTVLATVWADDPATAALLYFIAGHDDNYYVRQTAVAMVEAVWPESPDARTVAAVTAARDAAQE